MNVELKRELGNIGLSDKEVEIYLSGLELGQFSMSSLSHKTGIKNY